MLKSLLRTTLVLGLIALGAAESANASVLTVGSEIKFNNREGSTGGGEFGIALWSDPTNDLFRTFCVQVNEFMNFNNKFIVTGITNFSEPGHNPLNAATAALYEQFRSGSSTFFNSISYDHTPGTNQHTNDANYLQKAIWHLQNQSGYTNYSNLPNKSKLMVDEALDFVANNPSFGLGSVKILNITFANGDAAQDQLFLMPEQGQPTVPEPMSLLVWGGLGMVGLVVARRKRTVA